MIRLYVVLMFALITQDLYKFGLFKLRQWQKHQTLLRHIAEDAVKQHFRPR
jgi:hypothetical protein